MAFATNRFELFLDFGIRIKARSPAVQTFVIQLAANDGWTGHYLPSERAFANKGYSNGAYSNEVGSDGYLKSTQDRFVCAAKTNTEE